MSDLDDVQDIDDIIQECEELVDAFPANSHNHQVNKRMAGIARMVKEISDE